MSHLVFFSASELAKAIRDRTVSSVEVLDAHLEHIALHNSKLNAIITLDVENAYQRAKKADEALGRGEIWGRLHGVPITIKDSLETKGLRTTSSYEPLANYVPTQDATVVARLRAAGAILLGKTNTPKLTADFQTNSPLFGRTNNPWNLDYTSGGSTGGGAAAVAAGLSPLELGSDLGGSIRVPGHFCGVFGLKPTEHRVSTFGHIPELPGKPKTIRHLQTIGPLARCVEDLRLCLSLIQGLDPQQNWLLPIPTEQFKLENLRAYRYAWTTGFGDIPASTETKRCLEKLALSLENLGCCIEEHNPPNLDVTVARETYSEILRFEFGLSEINQQQYEHALHKRHRIITDLESFLSDWDVWLCPVVPIAAFTHRPSGEPIEIDGKQFPYLKAIGAYTTLFNLGGNPVIVLPLSQSQKGLPIGVQVVGRRGSDMRLIAIAETLTQITGGFQPPPGY
ncbi:MAG: amidase [Moorea sp. SIO4A3]|nr:amidase [Moorena sp. SIO4A3]